MDEITGDSPYGAGTLTGDDGSRQPSKNELEIARYRPPCRRDSKEARASARSIRNR
jgi:hypothetical protein